MEGMEMEVKNKNKSMREFLSIPDDRDGGYGDGGEKQLNKSMREFLSISDKPSKKKRGGVMRLLRTALFLFKLRGSKDLWQLLVCGLKQLHHQDNNLRKLEQPLPPASHVAVNNCSQNNDHDQTTHDDDDDDRFEEFIQNFYEQIRMQRSSSVGSTCHSPPVHEAPVIV